MKKITILAAMFIMQSCATTCDVLQVQKKKRDDGRTVIVWKCADKTIEATVKQLPPCMADCFEALP